MDAGTDLFYLFKSFGIFTLFAPFLLVFSLIWGLLRKSSIFGPGKERLYGLIAFSISAYFVASMGLVQFTQKFFSFFFYEMLVILMILLTFSLFVPTPSSQGSGYGGIVMGILGLTVVIALLYASSTGGEQIVDSNPFKAVIDILSNILIKTGLIYVIIFFVIVAIVINWATGSSSIDIKNKARDVLVITDKELEKMLENLRK